MKQTKLLLLIPLLFGLFGCKAKEKEFDPKPLEPEVSYDDVYLIMGQSNASGVSPHQFLQASNLDLYQRYTMGNSKVLMSYDVDGRVETNYLPTQFGFGCDTPYFGPEIGIADVLSKKEQTQYIIKASWGGSCLQTQYMDKNGNELELYTRYIAFIKGELKVLEDQGKNPRIRGIFWMQGESDSWREDHDYKQAQFLFFNHLKSDLNNWIYDYINIVDAYISTRSILWPHPNIVNECKQQLADENEHWYCIKTNGEDESALTLYLKCETNEGDDAAHYDSQSMVALGKAAGEYLIK